MRISYEKRLDCDAFISSQSYFCRPRVRTVLQLTSESADVRETSSSWTSKQSLDHVCCCVVTGVAVAFEALTRGRTGRLQPGYVLDDADRGTSSTSSTLTRSTRWNDIRCRCRCCCRCRSCVLPSASMLRLYVCASVFYFLLLGTPVPCYLA